MITVRGMGKALDCFDRELCVRRERFEDGVTIYKSDADEYTIEPSDVEWALKVGSLYVDLSAVVEWLAPFTDERSYAYYLHFHDNIVQELTLFEPYARRTFRRHLRLFHTHPAEEGGLNILGVLDLHRAWILVIEVDNQGGFVVEFLGTREMCRGLRSRLDGLSCKRKRRG